jgi:hypothetical protein
MGALTAGTADPLKQIGQGTVQHEAQADGTPAGEPGGA